MECVVMIKAEMLDLKNLAERYRETAGYYIQPEQSKKNLGYLIADLEKAQIDARPLREMIDTWIP